MAGTFIYNRYHFVWSTKNRLLMLDNSQLEKLFAYIGGILENKKCKLISAGGMPDHIHLLVSLHSQISIAEIVNIMKSNSSKWLRETFSNLFDFAWQEGYGAFSVSKSKEVKTKEYILNQEQHHSNYGFKEEFLGLLNNHQLSYDENHIWN